MARRWGVALSAALVAAMVSSANSQTIIGGERPPSVSVDPSVLDQLGPAPTLPQLFLTLRPPAASATLAPRTNPPHRTAHRKSTAHRIVLPPPTKRLARHAPAPANPIAAPRRLAHAGGAAKSAVVHLVPPPIRVADRVVTHDEAAATQTTSPTAAALGAPPPAPMPPLPQQDQVPPAPVLPPAPVHEEAPKPAVQPPPEATAAAPAATQAKPAQTSASVQLAAAGSAGATPGAIKFAPGATDLPPGSPAILDPVVAKLAANGALRLQLVARATGTDAQEVDARRVSLARAVAVRSYLIGKGVRSLRIDVHALGNRADAGPASDEVDLVVVGQ